MIPAEQVQEAVREQECHLLLRRSAVFCALASCGLDADHDVTEHVASELAVPAFSHRKSEHVGWTILLPILSVKILYLIVASYED